MIMLKATWRSTFNILMLAIFGLWSLVLTWPLAGRLSNAIPVGSETSATVPFFNLWTLQWNIDQLMQGYPRYWDAPIFAPLRGTFAFSEPQLLSAWLAVPVWLGGGSPALAYNSLILLFLTLNGWFACRLMRAWGTSVSAALLAGLLAQSLPFVTQEMGVLQLTALFGLLWSLFFLTRLLHRLERDQPALRLALGLALGATVTFLTCSYYGLFSLVFLPLGGVFQLHRKDLTIKGLGLAVGVLGLTLTLTGPFLLAQYRQLKTYNFIRSDATITRHSARPEEYLNFLDNNVLYGQILGLESGRGQRLFPGIGLLGLAGLGIWGHRRPRVRLYLLAAVLLAFVLSLGLRVNLLGMTPYQWLRDYLPGFRQLRSPFRFAALVQLHLALLAGFGLDNLQRWMGRGRNIVLATTAGFALLESLALPLPLHPAPNFHADAGWQTWLGRQSESTRIVLLPFAPGPRAADFKQTVLWMLQTRIFPGDMLNGYSGFFPKNHASLRKALKQFPTRNALNLLRQYRVSYVVIHHSLPGAPRQNKVTAYLPLVYWDEVAQTGIYALK